MSRNTPVPEVVITHTVITDDETGTNLVNIVIEIGRASCRERV